MPVQIPIDRERIADFCQRHHITEFALFGSVLRDDFGPDSDVDVMVEFEVGHVPGLFRLSDMEEELADIFGRSVDLITRTGVESSHNPYRRNGILGSAEILNVT